MRENLDLVIVTGMSGAGKSVAIQAFEDLGYFCVDNMPPALLPKFLELIIDTDNIDKVAVVVDVRSQEFYGEIMENIAKAEDEKLVNNRILFLDASDEELIKRYKETRRSHPLSPNGRLLDGIEKEREQLQTIKNAASIVIDTTGMSTRELRETILSKFSTADTNEFHIELMSFGFKYGLPLDSDIVMDVRFLPNPYYDKKLRPMSGLDKPVFNYVFDSEETQDFYNKFYDLLNSIIPGYKKEGKANLTISVGCTGGQHRSVAIIEKLGQDLGRTYDVSITHRDRIKSQRRYQ